MNLGDIEMMCWIFSISDAFLDDFLCYDFCMRILLAIVATILMGCTSAEHYLTWQGEDLDSMIRAWGPSNSEDRLEDGGAVYRYDYGSCRILVEVDSARIVRTISVIDPRGICRATSVAERFPAAPRV